MCEFVLYIYICDLSAVKYVEKQRKGSFGKKIPSFADCQSAKLGVRCPRTSFADCPVWQSAKNLKKNKNMFADCWLRQSAKNFIKKKI